MKRKSFFENARQFCSDLNISVEKHQLDPIEILFQFVFKNLIQFCRRKYSLTVQEAEDVANQAIQKFLERLNSEKPLDFDSGVHFLSYMRKIAGNVRLRWIAKELSDSKQVEINDFSIPELKQDFSLEKRVLQKELWTIVDKKLTNKQAEILRLTYIEGCEIEDIAQTLDLTIRQVKYEKSKALQMLRKVMNQKF